MRVSRDAEGIEQLLLTKFPIYVIYYYNKVLRDLYTYTNTQNTSDTFLLYIEKFSQNALFIITEHNLILGL